MQIVQEAEVARVTGKNFTAVHTGPFANLDTYKLDVPALNRKVNGKLFIRELLGSTATQISMNKMAPGISVPFAHRHKENEEVYIFIRGQGQIQVDSQVINVEEGTVVRINTAGSRCLRNNSNKDLHYICIQAKENSLKQDTFDDGIPEDRAVEWAG